MTSPNILLKILSIASFTLLITGFVAYRAGFLESIVKTFLTTSHKAEKNPPTTDSTQKKKDSLSGYRSPKKDSTTNISTQKLIDGQSVSGDVSTYPNTSSGYALTTATTSTQQVPPSDAGIMGSSKSKRIFSTDDISLAQKENLRSIKTLLPFKDKLLLREIMLSSKSGAAFGNRDIYHWESLFLFPPPSQIQQKPLPQLQYQSSIAATDSNKKSNAQKADSSTTNKKRMPVYMGGSKSSQIISLTPSPSQSWLDSLIRTTKKDTIVRIKKEK